MNFKKYQKVASIYVLTLEDAKKYGLVDENDTVVTKEGNTRANEDDCICIGVDGEIWPQPFERVKSKYDLVDSTKKDGVTFLKYKPQPGQFVEAKEMSDSFRIKDMNGKAGDYKVRAVDDHDDEWIVDKDIFEKTYEEI